MEDLMHLFALGNLEMVDEGYHPNNIRVFRDPFVELSEKMFIKMFRVSKDLCLYLVERLQPYIVPKRRATELDVQTKILIALKFYATGSYQLDVGGNKFLDVCQSTVSRVVKEVTAALTNPDIFNEWVCFPDSFEKLNKIRREFYEQHGFPGVVGCIDCTHVAIVSPKIDDPDYPEHLYVNRKHYHSINVQLICDSNLRIINSKAQYPGSTHDAYIWGRSNIQILLRNLHAAGHVDYFLIGDSGYPLRPWLLTPFDEVQNDDQRKYNRVLKCTRVKIECCNGVLKARFRCLLKDRMLHYKPAVACNIINACVVLHNMCIEYKLPEVDDEIGDLDLGIIQNFPSKENSEEDQENSAVKKVNPELLAGRKARNAIARNLNSRQKK